MASIANDPNGRKRILFVAPDESRKTIRLGKIDRKSAESICRHVEALLAAKIGGQPVPRDTAAWLANIGAALRDKLEAVGLVEAQPRLTVGEFLAKWLDGKKAMGHKPTSLRAWGQTVAGLVEQFGPRPLASLSHADGEAFRAAMQGRKLRATTIHKRLGHARQMLEDAARLGHISVNPWKHVQASRRRPIGTPGLRSRRGRRASHRALPERRLEAAGCLGPVRRPARPIGSVLAYLGRRGLGTRPTERAIAQDGTPGQAHRVIPIFPLLRPHLEAAFEQAPEGSVYIFPNNWRARATGDNGWAGANMRTTFAKIVRRAGVEPWPRLWHSLRASCESDLAQSFPLATVTKWLGNTPSVALRHYVDPTEAAFDRALEWRPTRGAKSGALEAQKAAQQADAGNGDESQNRSEVFEDCESTPFAACRYSLSHKDLREWLGSRTQSSARRSVSWS
jgi:integrase